MTKVMTNMCIISNNSGRTPLFFIGLLLFIFIFLLAACQESPSDKQVTYSGPIMGTDYRISLLIKHDADTATLEQLEKRLITVLQKINQSMSTYIADSELNQFNSAPSGKSVTLSPMLADVMQEAITISQLSDGAFDVTLAPAINLWGFGPDGRIDKRPTAKQLAKLRQSIGFAKLSLTGDSLSKSHDELKIDLSAIAKGYAVDRVAESLMQFGIISFLVNIGGELRGAGRKVDGSVWQVGIEKPQVLGGIQEIVALDNTAIATSGDYRNYYLIDGQQFSHTIDPINLTPVFHKLALVSVLADSAMRADALATAMMAMGEVRAQEFAKHNDLAAYMVIRKSETDDFRVVATDKFKTILR